MKKLMVLMSAGLLAAQSVFAVGDPTVSLSAEAMKSILKKYEAQISELGCGDLAPISGEVRGGATPTSSSQYTTIHLANLSDGSEAAILNVALIKAEPAFGLSSSFTLTCTPVGEVGN